MFYPSVDLLTVSDLTYRIKEILEYEPELQEVSLQGEVSNCTLHSSGHAYFTLKDEYAQISCVMFRGSITGKTKEILKHGAKIVVKGSVTVYPQRGNYQLLVQEVQAYGVGNLYQQFLMLKDKLQLEGLFDESNKKEIPAYPTTIGLITSPTGAVIKDILHTLQRRYPGIKLVLSPATVQGEQGAASVIAALQLLCKQPAIDVIIIARGGGSIEDLWCFNDESLAKAVYACPIPVISAIGHETDFTILDFVADLRAATPTAAAEHAVPDKTELANYLLQMRASIRTAVQYNLYNRAQQLDDMAEKTSMQWNYLLAQKKNELAVLAATLQQYNPNAYLDRGYSLTLKDGKVVKSVAEVASGDSLEIVLKDGTIRTVVE
ncbi:exodeoxyribonuclease VII large subunit [Rhodocytophaga aerolata]|uniref:Exodeoxyribonuclease 7 large subunit n=1 Tax=Rhodocytophaga aerolata TaxID=455078 RepID=A0ABT8QZR4_9BACT|nr:exodeoxyribonuclease VII large subunit [Rhodocytophaga aerolata]MDO1445336.1 exodeoxyribonuclease VII large subunit [Rhodocytophaga aerolata]